MPTLHWLNDEEARRAARAVPYRFLEEEHSLSYGDPHSQNLLIQGDNLAALKSLLPYYAGQVKCIYIDPPYNTGSAFEHYDDSLEHSTWLSMMYPRLELLRDLLAEDGSIWISIDDNEAHYIKIIADELFGRENFIINLSWKKRDGAPNDRKIGSIHEHILVFAKSKERSSKQTLAEVSFNLMPRTEKANSMYRVFPEPSGNDPRGPFRKIDTTANGKGGRFVQSLYYPIINPYTKEQVYPRQGTCWRHNQEEMQRLQNDGRLYWGVKGTAKTPMRKLFLFEAKQGMTTPSIWDNVGLNQHASSEIEKLFGEKAAFETPKPETLIQRIIHISTNPGDLVLDSFLGSGTTAAVAHKMGRRFIGIEMGEHAITHCVPRLQKVIDGEQGGISESVKWQGGGGYRFYKLGDPIFDENNRINPQVNFEALAAHVWFSETKTPLPIKTDNETKSPLLGIHNGYAYYLLFNGILGDKHPEGGNVLTQRLLRQLPQHTGPKIIYGEICLLDETRMREEGISFKKIPYEIKA